MSLSVLIKEISVLRLRQGDAVVVTVPKGLTHNLMNLNRDFVAKALARITGRRVPVLVKQRGYDLSILRPARTHPPMRTNHGNPL